MPKRISIYFDDEIIGAVEEVATLEDRSFSQMVCLLLRKAIKERNRKKKVNISDHTANPRPSNAG